MLAGEPAVTGNAFFDSFMAASAEYLAFDYDLLPAPFWVHTKERFLHRPVFPFGESDALKALFLATTPPPFKRRLIFVGNEPLSRPARYALGFTEKEIVEGRFPVRPISPF